MIDVVNLKMATFVMYSIDATGRGGGTRAEGLSVHSVSTSDVVCLEACIATVTLWTEGLEENSHSGTRGNAT